MLLEKAGVFMATGRVECEKLCGDHQIPKVPPREACERHMGDKSSPCSNNHMDFHVDVKMGQDFVSGQKTVWALPSHQ